MTGKGEALDERYATTAFLVALHRILVIQWRQSVKDCEGLVDHWNSTNNLEKAHDAGRAGPEMSRARLIRLPYQLKREEDSSGKDKERGPAKMTGYSDGRIAQKVGLRLVNQLDDLIGGQDSCLEALLRPLILSEVWRCIGPMKSESNVAPGESTADALNGMAAVDKVWRRERQSDAIFV